MASDSSGISPQRAEQFQDAVKKGDAETALKMLKESADPCAVHALASAARAVKENDAPWFGYSIDANSNYSGFSGTETLHFYKRDDHGYSEAVLPVVNFTQRVCEK